MAIKRIQIIKGLLVEIPAIMGYITVLFIICWLIGVIFP